MQKAEKNEEMEQVGRVFGEYIQKSPYLEWLFSEKLGYILMQIHEETSEIMESEVIEDPERFCRLLFEEVAQDVLELTGKEHDLHEADELERAEIEKRLLPYIEQLPQYEGLLEKLFERP